MYNKKMALRFAMGVFTLLISSVTAKAVTIPIDFNPSVAAIIPTPTITLFSSRSINNFTPFTVGSGDTINLQIRFTNNQHLEIFDRGTVGENFAFTMSGAPSSNIGTAFSFGTTTLSFVDFGGDLLNSTVSGSPRFTTNTSALIVEARSQFTNSSFLFRGINLSVELPTNLPTDFSYQISSLNMSFVAGDILVGVSAVPESSTLAIFGIGLAGLGFARRRRAA